MSDARQRWLWAAVCLLLASLPFLAVDFVPSTDLPQHLGQVRLFGEALRDSGDSLRIQWWTPYGLVYALMAVPWALFSPVTAGKVSVWLIVLLQVGVVHLAAAKWQRPIAGAVLATPFLFHVQLYWGFLNFLFGFLAFAAWYLISRRSQEDDESRAWSTAGLFLLAAGVLYLSHALWFACGLLWLAVEALLSRRSWSSLRWRALGVGPVVVAAVYWFTFLRGSNFSTPPDWIVGPLARLHPHLFSLAALGGLRHGIEALIVLAALVWVLVALLAQRKHRCFGCDPYLLALAGLFLVLYLVLPDKFSNTIRFSTRWLPFFFLSLVLAVGRPRLPRGFRRAVAALALAVYMVVTAAYWRAFEAVELDGLAESLAAIEGEPRVIGLSYMDKSLFINGQPFIQVFSWTYAAHGGVLNFSFGDFAPSLVVFGRDGGRPTSVDPAHQPAPDEYWTVGLEWFPKAVRRRDFQYFDYALIGGDEAAHQIMLRVPELQPVVAEGLWRLYRIDWPDATSSGP